MQQGKRSGIRHTDAFRQKVSDEEWAKLRPDQGQWPYADEVDEGAYYDGYEPSYGTLQAIRPPTA